MVRRARTGRLCREGGRRHELVSINGAFCGGLYEVLEQVDECSDIQTCINVYMSNSKREQHGYKDGVLSRHKFN